MNIQCDREFSDFLMRGQGSGNSWDSLELGDVNATMIYRGSLLFPFSF